MSDYIIMGLLLCFLAYTLLFGMKKGNGEQFFDVNNSKALRGFFCIIIILVHTRVEYQNKIQDMIGSFAYIGVTFFFMTSSYGLSLKTTQSSDYLKHFWRRRLPKLLIPCFLINTVITVIYHYKFSVGITLKRLFNINIWVRWLLVCYFFFWLSCLLIKNIRISKTVTSVAVIIFSIVIYYLTTVGIVTETTWTTECYGFVWGIVLASVSERFVKYIKEKWFLKWIICLVTALITGVAYLKFKLVPLYGDYLLKVVLGVVLITFILIFNVKYSLGNKVSLFLGSISFEIFLIQEDILYLLSEIMPQLSSGMMIIIGITAVVVSAFITHLITLLFFRVATIIKEALKKTTENKV